MGRRTTYDEDVAAHICKEIAGGRTLRAICREDGEQGVPHWTTVYAWIDAHEDFALRLARARDVGADAIAQEALDIADTPHEGVIETDKEGKNGPYTEVRRADMLDHRKLRIETRLKLLAVWNPKKYGQRLDIGNAGDEPFKVDVLGHVDPSDAARLLALIPLLEARARGEQPTDEDYSDIA